MKTLGIQIKTNEAIFVVLSSDSIGTVTQTDESTKFSLHNPEDSTQVKQFRDQINSAFDSINPDKIAIMARNANAKGRMTPSPISFKLEGIIQLYEKKEIQLISALTTNAYFKKHQQTIVPKNKYQQDAFDIAYYIMHK
jgi:indole-3-glycerol phosphate synthase